MNGSSSQMINGGITTNFYNLAINNSSGVNLFTDANVSNTLTLTNGDLSVGETTLGINGAISKTSGLIQTGATSSLSFGGSAALTLANNLFASTPSINNLTVNRSGGVSLGNQNMTVNGLLNLSAGTLTVGANTLTINGSSPTRTSGAIDASNANATLTFSNPSAIILPGSIFSSNVNNLSIIGTGGITASSDFTINGILNLQNANPSDIKGSLDMGGDTLTMGGLATTVGIGDVTGYVKRTSFVVNTPYSFGNEYTTINLMAGGTLPSRICVNIVLTPTHTLMPDAINRYYNISQTDGTHTTLAVLNLHYLDSELNGDLKSKLDLFDYHILSSHFEDHGRSNDDITNNWVGLSNLAIDYIAPSTSFAKKYWTLDTTKVSGHKWLGITSTDWTTTSNWTNGVPGTGDHVIIPDASTTSYSPTLPTTATIGYLTIELGGVLNATTGTPSLTIDGAASAWDCMGTFNPGASTVVFTNANASISDPTTFYNLTIASGAKLTLATNNIIKIAGALTIDGTLNASTNENTVEFNGSGTQVIPNPNGSTPGYHNLILSGAGTKTLPATIDIVDEFINNGTVDFGTGTVKLDGNSLYGQEISGTSSSTFYNLTLDNSSYGATLNVNAGVSHTLTLTSGKLTLGNYDLTLGNSATITGNSSFNYIITNGTGALSQRVTNTANDVVFPIGLASSYLPISVQLTSGSASDNIKARVGDGIYTAYSGNIPTGSRISSNVVDKTWYLQEGTAGGSNATVKVQWNTGDQGTSFDNTQCNISNYTGSSWKYATSSVVSGFGTYYSQSVSNITSFSPLGVFEQTLSGNINYYNNANSSLSTGITVKLFQDNAQVGSASNVTNGLYQFKGLPPGDYEMRVSSSAPVGAVNGTDAAQVNAWGVHPYQIEKVRFYAGDVKGLNGTPNNTLNAQDAQMILDNFVNETAFDRTGGWTFWTAGETISEQTSPPTASYPIVTVVPGNDNNSANIYSLITGDFNRSYSPAVKSDNNSTFLVYDGIIQVDSGQEFELPIHVLNQSTVGAVSLILNFPTECVEVQNVIINGSTEQAVWAMNRNELKIGWYSEIPLNFNANDILLTLKLKTKAALNGSPIIFTLAANPLNELADGQYEVINNAVLSIDAINTIAAGIQEQSLASDFSLSNYPNPYNGKTLISYHLPFDGKVTLTMYNYMGSVVKVLVDEDQLKGNHSLKLDDNSLAAGIYTATITVKNDKNTLSKAIKIVRSR